ncbi:MAG: type IV toxin-antitoxin system AbiEi family antitoxin [Prevotellaceae bacterium]|jgi:hypothetical protein|nr:type IV toxin-antitoxin system AbiEi family antitoxin [Prevotellaceae bacterium]
MNTERKTKINRLLQKQPSGGLFFSEWMYKHGISYELQRRYRETQWLTSIGTGVMIRSEDEPTIYSALSCYNKQQDKHFHIGAMTALDLQGHAHYIPVGKQTVVVFSPKNETLPKWLLNREWNVILRAFTTQNFSENLGITEDEQNGFSLQISSLERAFMECLHLAPEYYNLTDLYYVMETLNGLRPNLVQQLLEDCKSVKVKRLFLYMAEKSEHAWFKYLNLEQINLGNGKRALAKNGVYNAKYQITLPKDLIEYE